MSEKCFLVKTEEENKNWNGEYIKNATQDSEVKKGSKDAAPQEDKKAQGKQDDSNQSPLSDGKDDGYS